jgi:hypothetical protein
MTDEEKQVLRARDFWAALTLLALSLFFVWRTFDIPLFGGNRAGVSGAAWYNSAAIVPLGIFSALVVLSFFLLTISIRAGGARRALSAVGIGWHRAEVLRIAMIAVIVFFYVAALVPRVDFILASGLAILALTFGFYLGRPGRMMLSAATVAACGLYAMIAHLPQSEWARHDDDVVTLVAWLGLTLWTLRVAKGDRVLRVAPVMALMAPTLLVCAMAFGFRQNVPNRGGLIFSHIEYHYFVTLRPLWRG